MSSIGKHTESESFGFLVSNAPGMLDTGLVIAGARCGATGVLNCENVTDAQLVRNALSRIGRMVRRPVSIKFDADAALAEDLLGELSSAVDCVICTGGNRARLKKLVDAARPRRVMLEVTSAEQGAAGVELGVDGLLAKGHEAGGMVGEETTLVLLQHLLSECALPVWAHGGVGLHFGGGGVAGGGGGGGVGRHVAPAAQILPPFEMRQFVGGSGGGETVCSWPGLGICLAAFEPHR